MTPLEKAKADAYGIYMSRVGMMRDLVEDPSQLRACGYKTLEEALSKIVLETVKRVDEVFKKYEKENP